MEPTIYKPSIYNGAGIYKGAAGGGGGVDIEITKYQGSRGTPSIDHNWPNSIGSQQNRVSSQVIDLNSFIGKKIKISANTNFLVGAIDGTSYNNPYNEYSWDQEIELIIQYGTVTISSRKSDNSDITPDELNIKVVLLNA